MLGDIFDFGSKVVGAIGAGKRKRRLAGQRAQYESDLRKLEQTRQAIIDPYDAITDLSAQITNPFANIQVATKAAELQAEEADISLASTLDILRASDRGAGGATALAQAALKSKQGVSASIAQQEAENARLRAKGESEMQQRLLSEQIRQQQADVSGDLFEFKIREERELTQLDRAQARIDAAMAAENQASAAQSSLIGSAIGVAGSALGGLKSKKEETDG